MGVWRHDIPASTMLWDCNSDRIEGRSSFHHAKGVVKSRVKIVERRTTWQIDRSLLPVAQQPRFMAYRSRNFSREAPPGPSSPGPDTISAAGANESLAKSIGAAHKSAAGLLLMDSSLNLISFSTEAMNVLSYPDNLARLGLPEDSLARKVRSTLIRQESSRESPFVTEFRSGRRRYFCRVFLVASDSKDPSQPSLAVLLERGPSEVIPLSQVAQQFNLTQREREALAYLLQGLSSKAIANRMSISRNTVKAYMRMIMVKTGVSSRAAIVSKIILAQPQL